MATMRIVMISDAFLASVSEMKVQFVYIVLTTDESRGANIVLNCSNRYHRVSEFVLAIEAYVLSLAYEYCSIIRIAVEKLVGRPVSLQAYVDSQTSSIVVTKETLTA